MATRDTLHVEIVTAERELYSGEADMVSAPGSEGRLGILPRHAALLTTLMPGELTIKLDGSEEPIFVSGGFLEVSGNIVTVLADTAEYAEEIDQDRAELLSALERAMSRIRVAELARRRGGRRIAMPRSEQ